MQGEFCTDEPKPSRAVSYWLRLASILCFFAVLPLEPTAATLSGEVVGIADGDTLTLLDDQQNQHRIRLAGIDAPEKKQAFGNRSRQHLAAAVFRKKVTVVIYKMDRYGRALGKVLLEGQDLNLLQVKTGFAWHYKQYQHEQPFADRRAYAEAEDEARKRRLGLWRAPDASAPWEFRKAQRETRTTRRSVAPGTPNDIDNKVERRPRSLAK